MLILNFAVLRRGKTNLLCSDVVDIAECSNESITEYPRGTESISIIHSEECQNALKIAIKVSNSTMIFPNLWFITNISITKTQIQDILRRRNGIFFTTYGNVKWWKTIHLVARNGVDILEEVVICLSCIGNIVNYVLRSSDPRSPGVGYCLNFL